MIPGSPTILWISEGDLVSLLVDALRKIALSLQRSWHHEISSCAWCVRGPDLLGEEEKQFVLVAVESSWPVNGSADVETELAAAQVQTTVDQMKQKLQEQDLTKGMDLAKEAAIRATELLSEQDQLGVISFDDTPRWVVPTGFLEDNAAARRSVGAIFGSVLRTGAARPGAGGAVRRG